MKSFQRFAVLSSLCLGIFSSVTSMAGSDPNAPWWCEVRLRWKASESSTNISTLFVQQLNHITVEKYSLRSGPIPPGLISVEAAPRVTRDGQYKSCRVQRIRFAGEAFPWIVVTGGDSGSFPPSPPFPAPTVAAWDELDLYPLNSRRILGKMLSQDDCESSSWMDRYLLNGELFCI